MSDDRPEGARPDDDSRELEEEAADEGQLNPNLADEGVPSEDSPAS